MKQLSSCLFIILVLLFSNAHSLYAQGHFTTPTYTPHFSPVFHPMQFNGYYGTVSMKHKFKVVFTNGTDTIVSTTIHADTPSYYLLLENKSVGKKDSARFRKIYPSQTKYIVRLDKYNYSHDKYEETVSKTYNKFALSPHSVPRCTATVMTTTAVSPTSTRPIR